MKELINDIFTKPSGKPQSKPSVIVMDRKPSSCYHDCFFCTTRYSSGGTNTDCFLLKTSVSQFKSKTHPDCPVTYHHDLRDWQKIKITIDFHYHICYPLLIKTTNQEPPRRSIRKIRSEIESLHSSFCIINDPRVQTLINQIRKQNEPKIYALKQELQQAENNKKEPKPLWPSNTPQPVLDLAFHEFRGTTEFDRFRVHWQRGKWLQGSTTGLFILQTYQLYIP